jgi:3-phosphoshikimate 1-carboxyvinyltransferase
MSTLSLTRSAALRGSLRLPSDLQIGQEALLWAALAEGASELTGLSPRDDHRVLCAALRALGVPIAEVMGGAHVQGVGLKGLRMPSGALDAEASVSTLELLSALLSGQAFGTRVEARAEARTHPLRTVIEPLRSRGAQIAGKSGEGDLLTAPVAVAPLLAHERLAPVEIEIPNGDAATKRALLISGLYADGVTAIQEGLLSRDHTERALLALGAPIETMGPLTLLDTSLLTPRFAGFRWRIPADFSLAAHVIALALALPGSDVLLEDVGVNPSRTAFLAVLRHGGAEIEVTPKGDTAGDEPVADIRVRASALRGSRILGELALRLASDVPAVVALAMCAKSRLSLRDLGSLRAREGDVLKRAAQLLRAFGGECTDYEDGLDIDPVSRLAATTVSADTPRPLKLLGLVLGLCAEGETRIEDGHELDAFCPGLLKGLRALGAPIAETR